MREGKMDEGNSEQKTISLFIKTPNQAYGDHSVEGVSLGWTVKELKTHLSTVYPSRPVGSERLWPDTVGGYSSGLCPGMSRC